MSQTRKFAGLLLALWVLLLAACATSPYQGEGKTRSDALLQAQFEQARQRSQEKPEGRLIFAGAAMHSQSKAFRSDVLLAEKTVLAIDPNAIVFKLSNPVSGQDADWPYATVENVALVLKQVAALAGAADKIVLLISTHGNVGKLAVNFGGAEYSYIDPRWLNRALAPLQDKPTLLLLSACFSGSFVEPLNSTSRIILTASAKDRNSFGCQFHSTNTYFVDALLNQPAITSRSVAQLMEQAKIDVDQRERKQRLSPPSLPQISVGSAVKAWANEPLNNWHSAR
jgi:hypothetical protein